LSLEWAIGVVEIAGSIGFERLFVAVVVELVFGLVEWLALLRQVKKPVGLVGLVGPKWPAAAPLVIAA
jgi:hypothetical protein